MSLLGTFEKFDPSTENFNNYYNRFLHFLRANAITDKERQTALFLTILGGDTYNLLQSLIAPQKIDQLSLEEIAEQLSLHYQPRPLIIMETYNFMKRNQQAGETATAYLATLRKLAINCEFGEYLERALRDKFVSGLESQVIQRRLLTESELTVTRAVQIAQTMELADAKAKELHTLSASVQRLQVRGTSPDPRSHSINAQHAKPATPCPRCGKSGHWASDCRFRNAICNFCKRRGHILAACKQRSAIASPRDKFHVVSGKRQINKHFTTHNVDSVSVQPDDQGQEQEDYNSSSLLHAVDVSDVSPLSMVPTEHSVDAITIKHDEPVWIPLKINGISITMEFDPGAATTLVNQHVWKTSLGSPALEKADNLIVTAYGGVHIEVMGQVNVEVESKGKLQVLPLLVVSGSDKPLLGRNWMKHIPLDWAAIIKALSSNKTDWHAILESLIRSAGLEIPLDWRAITRYLHANDIFANDTFSIHSIHSSKTNLGDILSAHAELFQNGLGHCKNIKAHISLKENAVPRFYKARTIPYSIKDKVEAELLRMEGLGIITKISHSEWAAPVVPVMKPNGSLRLCGGFHLTINPQINLERYPLPRPERLFNELVGGEEFSELDLAEAYLQCELDEQSKQICVINTHKGLYRFNRLPFGVASAAAIFQEVIDQIIVDIPFVKAYQDDSIISGKNRQEHFLNLTQVLDRLSQNCLRIRKEKCKFLQKEVQFLGFMINAAGRRPVESKLDPIRNMPIPQNVHNLRAFLGMINHYHQFIKNVAALAEPLNALLRNDTIWKWTSAQQMAFDALKAQLTSDRLLVHYDPALPLGLSCDASNFGLGAVLFHRGSDKCERPIAYASCTLSEAQRRYSQIEKEAASIIFAVNKFYEYIWGRRFILVTDHKPLLAIFGPKKGFPERSINRLQRWSIALAAYTYDIEYRPTERHGNADALSRLPLKQNFDNVEDIEINQIQAESFAVVPISADEIRRYTNKDKVLAKVRLYLNSDWPNTIEDPTLKAFCENRNLISEHAGCLFLGFRIIIPQLLQSNILTELHCGHIGIVKMKSVARQYVWWPTLDKDIENMAKGCNSCAQQANNPAKVPNHPWEPPKGAWQRIHLDYAGPYLNSYWLIVVDAFTRWPEVIQTTTLTATRTISELRKLFARFGIPEIIVTDNGTQFTGHEFQEFLRSNRIVHKRTAPYHPATNGLAERFVQTFKHAMDAAGTIGHELALQQFLFAYRNAPHSTTHETPASMMLQFRPRTRLDLLKPPSIQQSRPTQVPHVKPDAITRSFNSGDPVQARMYTGKSKWVPGVIVRQTGTLHYEIQTQHGVLSRHIDQIQKGHSSVNQDLTIPEDEFIDWAPTKHRTNIESGTETRTAQHSSTPPTQLKPQSELPQQTPDQDLQAQPSTKKFFWQKQKSLVSPIPRTDGTTTPREQSNENHASHSNHQHADSGPTVTQSRYPLRSKSKVPIHSILFTCIIGSFIMSPTIAVSNSDSAIDVVHYNYNTTILPLIRLVNEGELSCNSALSFVMHDIAKRQSLTIQKRTHAPIIPQIENSALLFFTSLAILGIVIVILIVTLSRFKVLNCPCKMAVKFTARSRRHRYPRSLPVNFQHYRELQGNRHLAIGYP